MELLDYLREEPGRGTRLARALQTPQPSVSNWAHGARPVPLEWCSRIERATDGAVRRWNLRPDDWHEHWPELVGTPGAPPVPSARRRPKRRTRAVREPEAA